MADFYKNFEYYGFYKNGGLNGASTQAVGIQYEVPPLTTAPLDINTFKEHARIDFNTDDSLVQLYIFAATKYLEEYCQKSFGVRTVTLAAEYLPPKYRLMYGPVDSITTAKYTNTLDILNESLTDSSIQYTTKDTLANDPVVIVAVARYAAGLYIERENVIDSKYANSDLKGEAERMLASYRNIIFP